jgi:hypothetical protein
MSLLIRLPLRSLLLRTVWLSIFLLAVNAIWLTTSAAQAPQQLAAGGELVAARQPYTVVLRESLLLPSGDVTGQGTLTMALRSDGAYAERYEHFGIQNPLIQRTIDLASGINIVVDDIRELQTTRVKRVGAMSRARMDGTKDCLQNSLREVVVPGNIVGKERIDGYATVKTLVNNTTTWFAVDLGCAKVKSRTRLEDGTINQKVADRITPGEPDQSLFFVPARYEEVPPSTFYALDATSKTGLQLDRTYYSLRPPK